MSTHHHKLIKQLIARVRELSEENGELNDSFQRAQTHYAYALQRKEARIREVERRSAGERADAEYRESQRERLMRDLERARRYKNKYEEDRILRKLRNV